MSMSVCALVMVGESGVYTFVHLYVCTLWVFSASFGDFLRKCAWLRV